MLEVDRSVNSELSVVSHLDSRLNKTESVSGHLQDTLLCNVEDRTAGNLTLRSLAIVLISQRDGRLSGNLRVVDSHLIGLHITSVHLCDVNDSLRQCDRISVNVEDSVLRQSRTALSPGFQLTRGLGLILIGACGSGIFLTVSTLHVQDLTLLKENEVRALAHVNTCQSDRGGIGVVAFGLNLNLHLVDVGDAVVAAQQYVDALCIRIAVGSDLALALLEDFTVESSNLILGGTSLNIDCQRDVIPLVLVELHSVLCVTVDEEYVGKIAEVVLVFPVRGLLHRRLLGSVGSLPSTLQLGDGKEAQRVSHSILAVVDGVGSLHASSSLCLRGNIVVR